MDTAVSTLHSQNEAFYDRKRPLPTHERRLLCLRSPLPPAWKALQAHHANINASHMRDLFAADPARFEKFSLTFQDILFDYSKKPDYRRKPSPCCWRWPGKPG
ncbi:MAG: hypothetical protein M5U34_38610 [Chloroflexi bacterium]|nr:hypothetical protein [Chloroflexota bacterium]